MTKLWQKLTAAALMSAAMLGAGLTAKPLLPVLTGTEITAEAADEVTVGDLTFRVYDTYAAVQKCKETAVTVNIPAKVSGVPVTCLLNPSFAYCKALTGVTIPDSVKTIGGSAFSGCTKLTGITIPDSVVSIGSYAFDNCTGLASVSVGKGVTSIGEGAFYDCENLKSITLPDSVTSIGDHAFSGCEKLKSITIPDSVTSIGEGAFEDCESLTDIMIPDGVIRIGEYAFSGCTDLTSITIPDGVTFIGEAAFEDCESLTDIKIPDSVTSIGRAAFYGCKGLKSITIPDSVTEIGLGAFFDCKNLKSITIPDGVTGISESAFSGCTALTGIIIPDSVTSIGAAAFYDCKSLKSIMLPDSVTGISDYAFLSCINLTSITIPESVTSIGEKAFSGCTNLTVQGAAGSYAERYAAENSIPFVQKTFLHSADVRLSKTDFAYTGSPVKIGSWITVTVNGRKLTYGTDFVTVYKNNVGTGYQTASVTVKGRGDYAGQVTKKFTIKPAKPAKPTLTTANGGIHVTWQRDANADGVLVRYSKNRNFSSGCHDAVYMTKTATDLKKFTKSGETWYVKIYSFIKLPDGTKRGSWSDAVSIRVK